MFYLIKNESIKIFKRKNIYILLLLAFIVIVGFNLYSKFTDNITLTVDKQYKRAYEQDNLLIENYDKINTSDNIEEIKERLNLEQYALENNIKYNILLNSENTNATIQEDARILLMRFFNNFDIIIILIVIYISSTIINEERNNGTIKNLLIKPYARSEILLSKIITNLLIILILIIVLTLFQYLIGGIIFGFDSYSLEAIIYEQLSEDINTMNLLKYIIVISVCKIPIYMFLSSISMLIGEVTKNIPLNILISLGLYELSINNFIEIYNWYISLMIYVIILMLLNWIFNKRDIINEY